MLLFILGLLGLYMEGNVEFFIVKSVWINLKHQKNNFFKKKLTNPNLLKDSSIRSITNMAAEWLALTLRCFT